LASAGAPAPADSAPAPEDLNQCVAKHFAPDAFDVPPPRFDFLCGAVDPRRAALELGARLIFAQQRKGGPVSDAMKEWSILNWYELAFVTLTQHACCKNPPAPDTKVGKTCSFDEALAAVGVAGSRGQGLDEAITTYDTAVQCLINFGLSPHYKQDHPTYGPERDAFRRISERSRQ
jgi:hypothetical protein